MSGRTVRSKAHLAVWNQNRERMAAASPKTAYPNPLELVIRVREMSREVGGIKNLKMLVELVAE